MSAAFGTPSLPADLTIGPVYWLEQALAADPGQPAPPLTGTERADVCIVGGGFTGLWTANEIKRLAPDASVVVLEAMSCGFGASGRNGGWMTSWYDDLDGLVEHFGREPALFLADQSSKTIDWIEDFTEEKGIDCSFRRAGSLWFASYPSQIGAIEAAREAAEQVGRGQFVESLDGAEMRRRTGARVALDGLRINDSATVQPAALVRGLRRAALEAGVRIHEGSPMIEIKHGRRPLVSTPAGAVEAGQVVFATGAWSADLLKMDRSVLVVASHIVATEPIPERLADLPWRNGELAGDARLFVHYAQVTPEGRIVFGRGGGEISRGSKVTARQFVDPEVVAEVIAGFRQWFRELADVRITHAWGGPVDRSPGYLPFVGSLGEEGNVHYGYGYSGNGVGPTSLVGRIQARRALGIADKLSTCALVSGPRGFYPPEPLRNVGGAAISRIVAAAEAREAAGKSAAGLVGLGGRLLETAPTLSPRFRASKAQTEAAQRRLRA
jgi:glycine/D-amino acid oxidase-like deaminating enzyme